VGRLALRETVYATDSPNNVETRLTVLTDAISQAELNRAGMR